ncbi:hypothetical protein AB1E18_011848 [Capra hircus]
MWPSLVSARCASLGCRVLSLLGSQSRLEETTRARASKRSLDPLPTHTPTQDPCCQRKSITLLCEDQSQERPGPKPAQTQQALQWWKMPFPQLPPTQNRPIHLKKHQNYPVPNALNGQGMKRLNGQLGSCAPRQRCLAEPQVVTQDQCGGGDGTAGGRQMAVAKGLWRMLQKHVQPEMPSYIEGCGKRADELRRGHTEQEQLM